MARWRILARVNRTRIVVTGGLVALSVVACLFGAAGNLKFETTPGAQGAVPLIWPAASKISRASGRLQVLVFVHPLCGCTTATLSELARVKTELNPQIDVLFYRSAIKVGGNAPGSWAQAVRLPNSRVAWDEAGEETKRFGAETSGFILLYGRKGELLFHGGITGSRGHEGDNYGLDQLMSAIATGRPAPASPPVFGCGLLDRARPTK